MGFLRLNLLKPFEYVKETKKDIQEEMGRIEPTVWREALIQKYYLRLENPFVSGGRDLNPQPSPWEGDILPLNYHRKLNWDDICSISKRIYSTCSFN